MPKIIKITTVADRVLRIPKSKPRVSPPKVDTNEVLKNNTELSSLKEELRAWIFENPNDPYAREYLRELLHRGC